MFSLHPQLLNDSEEIGDLPLCRVLLANDARYPWLILVPRRSDIREIYELTEMDQLQLFKEASSLAKALAGHFSADKMNVAALGNQVPQLHVHIVVRYVNDDAWPGPIWGKGVATSYEESQLLSRKQALKSLLSDLSV